jgi:hypothetical protein
LYEGKKETVENAFSISTGDGKYFASRAIMQLRPGMIYYLDFPQTASFSAKMTIRIDNKSSHEYICFKGNNTELKCMVNKKAEISLRKP